MSKLTEIKFFLNSIGMPTPQQSDLCCYTLLAMLQIDEKKDWSQAMSIWIRIHDIIKFIKENYGIVYAENSRETFRKQAIHHFRNAALIEDNGQATNSPNYRYRITREALVLIQSIKKPQWHKLLDDFLMRHKKLIDIYSSQKKIKKMPVRINEKDLTFSPGKHNELQKSIIEEFAPRFAPGCSCLYVGDTIEKDLIKDEETLSKLGFSITLHDKMPDIVLYCAEKDWIYFIEAVTSVGPMNPKRIKEINEMTRNVKSGKIFITAFLDFKTFKSFSEQLAWDTEVWIASMPDHMIHLNGDKFMGPR